MIVSPEDTYEADVLIEDGGIECIGKNLEAKFGDADKVIDAKGKYVLPGGIDVHTHMDIDVGIARAVDDFYTGTVAAACGGTTTIVDHMGFGPAGCPLHHQLDVYHGLADDKAVIDYGFHGVVQHVDESILNELETMMDDGVQSTKVYMTYGYKIDDDGILEVLKKMKELHGITAFHCENHYVVEHLKKEYGDAGKTAPIYHAKSRPNIAEADFCAQRWLDKELAILQPKVVVALGSVALHYLGNQDMRITRDRGKWFKTKPGFDCIATFHPAYLLRISNIKALNAPKYDVFHDLEAARDKALAAVPDYNLMSEEKTDLFKLFQRRK